MLDIQAGDIVKNKWHNWFLMLSANFGYELHLDNKGKVYITNLWRVYPNEVVVIHRQNNGVNHFFFDRDIRNFINSH